MGNSISVPQIEMIARNIAGIFVANVEIVGIFALRSRNDLGRHASVAIAPKLVTFQVVDISEVSTAIEKRGAGDLNRLCANGGVAHVAAMAAVGVDSGRSRSGRTIFIFGITRLFGSCLGTGWPIAGMNLAD